MLGHQDRRLAESFAQRLRERFGGRLQDVRVFGSRARGEARADSDLDIWVLLDEASPDDRRTVCDLAVDYVLQGELPVISPRVMSRAQYARLVSLERLLPREIERDGIPL